MTNLLRSTITGTQNIITSLESLGNSRFEDTEHDRRQAPGRQAVVLINYAGMLYILSVGTIIFLVTITTSLPFYHTYYTHPDSSLFWSYCFAWYSYISFLTNYVLILYGAVQSVYCSPKELPLHNVLSYGDWAKCSKCDRSVPPRTRHCDICNRCILKRDHHCFLTGCCIGFYNQRYFICMSFHCLLGSLFGLYYLHVYLSSSFVTFFSVEFYKYIFPYTIVTWLFGYQDFSTVLMVLLFYMTVIAVLAELYFLVWQSNLMVTGQTSYELVKGQKLYQTTLMTHIRSVFGPYWLLNFVIPVPFIKSEDDGVEWKGISSKFL